MQVSCLLGKKMGSILKDEQTMRAPTTTATAISLTAAGNAHL